MSKDQQIEAQQLIPVDSVADTRFWANPAVVDRLSICVTLVQHVQIVIL